MKHLSASKAFLLLGVLFLSGVIGTPNIALAQGSKTFNKPMVKGHRLDWCRYWGKQCGKPAADEWCSRKMGKADGYALDWKVAANIGRSTPTYVVGDKKVCNKSFCDGFQWIKCGFSLD